METTKPKAEIKLSEVAMNFFDGVCTKIHEFDIQEQNDILLRITDEVLDTRKRYLEKTANEREQYGIMTDELIKKLHEIE